MRKANSSAEVPFDVSRRATGNPPPAHSVSVLLPGSQNQRTPPPFSPGRPPSWRHDKTPHMNTACHHHFNVHSHPLAQFIAFSNALSSLFCFIISFFQFWPQVMAYWQGWKTANLIHSSAFSLWELHPLLPHRPRANLYIHRTTDNRIVS